MSTPAPPSSLDARISASLDNWKRKLLDLTKRNRLLNFKINKVTTITIVDELPTEVFRRLYLAEESLGFRPSATDEPEESEQALLEGPNPLEEDPDLHDAEEFAPYDASGLAAHHADDWLQTTASPERLDRSLRRLEEQARLTIEEQGVNTLFLALGMLHYTESDDSEVAFRAPLVLLPVELSRKTARSDYELRAADDEPMVNTALAEYLRRAGVGLPTLPDAASMPENYGLQTLFAEVAQSIAPRKGWKVTTEIYLGLFSFQKFAMFKDLETHAEAIAAHRLTKQLVGRMGTQYLGLPDEIRDLELDQEFPPESTFQVVDADSSQLYAMAAASRNHDLVVEGPPGTGKSQTITNLIAQALAAGKSVLFVAEKMAALSVVHSRLVGAGLGEFCLELHSSKVNKRVVMRNLAASLDASLQPVAHANVAADRLPPVRHTLSDYANALHTPFGAFGMTPYRGYGELEALRTATPVSLTLEVETVTREQFDQALRDLGDMAVAATHIGTLCENPWRDSHRTFYTEDVLADVEKKATRVRAAADVVLGCATVAQQRYGLPTVAADADVPSALEIGAFISQSPGAPTAVLKSDAWNAPPTSATRMVEDLATMADLKSKVTGWFKPEVMKDDHTSDIDFVEAKTGSSLSFLAFLNGRYRAIRKRWRSYRLDTYRKSMAEQAADMKVVTKCQAAGAALRERETEGRDLFGQLWRGEASDRDALQRYITWVVQFRKTTLLHGLAEQAAVVAADPHPDDTALRELDTASTEYRAALAELRKVVEWPDTYLASEPWVQTKARVEALISAVTHGPRWAAFEQCRQAVAGGLASELLPQAMAGELNFGALPRVFARAFHMKWLSQAVQQRDALKRFQTLTHEQRVIEFRELDERVLRENRTKLVQHLRDIAQTRLRSQEAISSLPHLRREMAKQRAISPLRRIIKVAAPAIRAITPCLMMSPLTVAQMLDGAAPAFDLVIFDEASQLPTEDAIGAVTRGNQLVVVGDPKQLPPTNFFAVTTGQTAPQLGEDGLPIYADSESILEEFMGAGVPMSRLKWHYRSAHESLITFSNVSFYDADLYTFPSIDVDTATHGLQFEYLADGRYEGKGFNAVEARRVADAVVEFATHELAREQAGQKPLSLGVGTFNLRQQIAIQDELELRRRSDPSIEPFFDRGRPEPFFVKNLENIQGDERDVIFLSVTYGRGLDGRIRYNFGPLNGENGWRRLNVIITRAKKRMRVFSSMRGEDINPTTAVSQGPRLLREFLIYAEHGKLDGTVAAARADTDSPFEREVFNELTNRGLRVLAQVGSGGYRIDLAVIDPEVQGRFVCGIECDGVAYHSAETARDRDRLRQQVLEARGWTIHRVWSTDWFKDRQGQIERLLRLIEGDRRRLREDDASQREVEARLAREAAAERQRMETERQAEVQQLEAALDASGPYRAPTLQPYIVAQGNSAVADKPILETPESTLIKAVRAVVDAESPIHELEAFGRVASFWGSRLGSRIQARIARAASAAVRAGLIQERGKFFWNNAGTCVARSRTEIRMGADRIAPEEYEQVIRTVLGGGHGFARPQLIGEVREALGFARTGRLLEDAIGRVVDQMLHAGALGEGSMGIRLREVAPSTARAAVNRVPG